MKIAKTSTSTSSSVVQSNAFHSQFADLSDQREKTSIAIEENEAEYKQILEHVRKLKTLERTLSVDITKTQGELGTQQSKRTMLHQEKARKNRVFENERKALEQCSRKAECLVEKETKSKRDFCKEMATLHDELEELVQQEHDLDFQKHLSVLSLTSTVMKQSIPSELVDAEALNQSFQRLCEIEKKICDEAQKYRTSQEMLGKIVSSSPTGVTDFQPNEAPRVSDEDPNKQGTRFESDPNDQDHHMNLFYGSQND